MFNSIYAEAGMLSILSSLLKYFILTMITINHLERVNCCMFKDYDNQKEIKFLKHDRCGRTQCHDTFPVCTKAGMFQPRRADC